MQFEPSRLKQIHLIDAYEKLVPISKRIVELPKEELIATLSTTDLNANKEMIK